MSEKAEFPSAFNGKTTVVVAQDNLGRIYLKIRVGRSSMGSITLGSESVIPFARAVLDAAGADADVVEVPDVKQGTAQRYHDFTVDGVTYTIDHDESPTDIRAMGLAYLAIARHLEARPDPQVEKLAGILSRWNTDGKPLDHYRDQAKALIEAGVTVP